MTSEILDGYEAAAPELAARYNAITPEDMYRPVKSVMPDRPKRVLDIGGGSGRDAAWFAGKGSSVVAIEPAPAMRDAGKALHGSLDIEWRVDQLPELTKTMSRGKNFDLILLSGVWQHLDREMRETAMKNLARLCGPGGTLIMSVRDGPGAPTRPVFPADVDHTINCAGNQGLALLLNEKAPSVQKENQDAGVTWNWLAFSSPG